jgi:replication factor C subunit 2/4
MTTNNINIWVEKYRPSNINDIINQEEIKTFLNGAITEKNIPHLLLHGPPGTGKTTIANILIKNLYSYNKNDFPTWDKIRFFEETKKLRNDRILSLNASDERGIKVVREKIKSFASLSIVWQEKDKNIPPFKTILLDEADAMSSDSQFALRRIMEKYSHNTRFILICNYVTKIISPLASRCSKFRFLPVSYDSSKFTIEKILSKEGFNVKLSDDVYMYIYQYTNGDMRKTITLFQRLSYVTDFQNISIEDIRNTIGEIPNNFIDDLTNILNNPITYDNQIAIYSKANEMITGGYNYLFLINHLYHHYLQNANISDNTKYKIISKLSETDNKLNDGSVEIIQAIDMLFTINGICNNISYRYTNNPFGVMLEC